MAVAALKETKQDLRMEAAQANAQKDTFYKKAVKGIIYFEGILNSR